MYRSHSRCILNGFIFGFDFYFFFFCVLTAMCGGEKDENFVFWKIAFNAAIDINTIKLIFSLPIVVIIIDDEQHHCISMNGA
jgi:hypothetical protein